MLRTGCLLAPQRDFVVTLRQSGLPYRRPPATALLGHYADRTLTGKFITAFRTHTTAASDAHPASTHFPRSSVIGHPASSGTCAQAAGPGRASPVPAVTIRTFRAPYAGEFFTLRFPGLRRFHGLRPDHSGLGSPLSHLTMGIFTTRQASLDAADRSVAPPLKGF